MTYWCIFVILFSEHYFGESTTYWNIKLGHWLYLKVPLLFLNTTLCNKDMELFRDQKEAPTSGHVSER